MILTLELYGMLELHVTTSGNIRPFLFGDRTIWNLVVWLQASYLKFSKSSCL